MSFPADDVIRFNQLLEQMLSDPSSKEALKARLGVAPPAPPAEPKVITRPIEEKVYRRVDKYTGASGTWQEWSFAFVNATSGVNPEVGKVLERIGHQCETQLTPETLARCVNEEARQKFGPELFAVLCGLTAGDANAVVRGILAKHNMRCGFAAYFMLSVRFNPKTPARALQFLHTVVNPIPIKDVRLIPKGIEEWEAKRSVMENEFGEALSDRMAAAIVTAMLPPEFQDMVYQAQGGRPVIYAEVRDKVLSVAGIRIQQASPTPMDVGAVTTVKDDAYGDDAADADRVNQEINQIKGNGKGSQCYRCGGYGHIARNCSTPPVKGKGKGDEGKGGKGQGKEDRVCYNCGKKGHLSKDCWSVKGKGKGKGKEVNGLGDAKADNSWMVAGVFVNPDPDSALLGPIATSNYWDELWSEDEDDEEQPPELLLSAESSVNGEEELCGTCYPPGLRGEWEEDEGPSLFDQLFSSSPSTQVKEEEFEVVEDDDEKQLGEEEIDEAVIEYPSVNGGIFDMSYKIKLTSMPCSRSMELIRQRQKLKSPSTAPLQTQYAQRIGQSSSLLLKFLSENSLQPQVQTSSTQAKRQSR